MKFVKLYELKIFTAEDVQCGDEPFFKAVFKEARRLGLGGGTMVRADAVKLWIQWKTWSFSIPSWKKTGRNIF